MNHSTIAALITAMLTLTPIISNAEVITLSGPGQSMDAYIDMNAPDVNYGATTFVETSSTSRFLIQFDTTDISTLVDNNPLGVKKAMLRLFVTSLPFENISNPATIHVTKQVQYWVEGPYAGFDPNSAFVYGATWNSPLGVGGAEGGYYPWWSWAGFGSFDITPVASLAVNGTGWWEWDVTAAVQGWVADPNSNYGLTVWPDGPLPPGSISYISSEGAPLVAPQLVVSIPEPATTALLLPVVVLLRRRR